MFRSIKHEENRPTSVQEKHDFDQTKFMQKSPLNNVSIVHSSRGLIAVVKLGGSLYVPSSCLSRLVNLDHDQIIDRIKQIGVELREQVSISPTTDAHSKIQSYLLNHNIAIAREEEIRLIPIAAAIRILTGTLKNVELIGELDGCLQAVI